MSHFSFLPIRKSFVFLGLLLISQVIVSSVFADNVIYSYSASPANTATSSSNANVPASGCISGIGNSLGTVATPVNTTSASSVYSGATGGGNIGNAVAVTGNSTFNSGTSPYITFTLTPNSGYSIAITGMTFGSRSTGTGPQAYTISTSVGGFAAGVASGTLLNNSVWALQSPSFTTVTGSAGSSIEVRIYAYGGAGSPAANTENWRIDDINFTITVSGGNNAPSFAGGTSQSLTVCQNASATAINSLMAINDADAGQTETWTVSSGPAHGTLGGFSTTATSTGSTITPSGLTYTPTSGYTGTDAFAIQIYDGIATATSTVSVTVNPLPSSPSGITGTAIVCQSSSTSLSESTTGGVWSSTNGAIATVGTSGIVSGVAEGTATISYTVTNSCGSSAATAVVTVNPLPSTPSPIIGTATVCAGSTTALTETSTGGAWSTTDGTVATVGTSGVVTGVAAGTATISYTLTNSCGSSAATVTITVNPLPTTPSAITGTGTVCTGSTTTLTETSTGGAWSSTDGTIATVGTTGIVTGVAAGTATISYTISNSCGSAAATFVVTVNTLPSVPSSITGTATVCAGSTTSLSETTTGGTWSSTDGSVATVGTSGTVTGVSSGTATISYTMTNGCGSSVATIIVTVNPLPATGTITGVAFLAVGGTTTLSDATSGGTWSSVTTSVATIGTSGVVTGVATGTSAISYTVTNGCGTAAATVIVTVNPATFGRGNLVVLRTGDGSAALTSAATAIFAIEYTTSGSATGFNIALPATGSTKITNSGSASSEGMMTSSAERDRLIVEGYNATAGTASVVSTSAATSPRELFSINSSGSYAAVVSSTTAYSGNNIRSGTANGTDYFSAGTAGSAPNGIVYLNSNTTLATTPTNTRLVQIFNGQIYFSASSSPFLGVAKMGSGIPTTSGQTATLINTTTTASAYGFSISPDGGTLYIADDGAGINKYTGSGSSFAFAYNVNSTPVRGLVVDYSGTNPIIYATTSALSSGNTIIKITDGGSGSGSTTIATAPANTEFRGIQFAPSCFADISISGSSVICSGSSTSLQLTGNPNATVSYNINGGSTLTTTIGNNGKATLSTGALTTNSTFNLISISTTACSSVGLSGSVTVTVNPVPTSITGTTTVCAGSTTTLGNVGSGTWSTSDVSIATVGSGSGIVTGVAPGTATITYALTCGTVNALVTVNPLPATPASISGSFTLCAGSTTTLTESVSGGSWSSNNTSIVTVGTSGVVTGVASGSTTITYTITNSCGTNYVTAGVTVNPLPSSISGTPSVCTGQTTSLTDAGGGTWTSSNSNAAAGSGTGIVSGVTAGTSNITYTLSSGCFTFVTVTVNASPSSITGTTSACVAATSTLADGGGGTWTSSNANASVGSSSGIVTGVTAGTSTITYTLPSGCFTTVVFTINAVSAGIITGSATICNGSTASYNNTVPMGTWSSTNPAIATINSSTGVAAGITTGVDTIVYTVISSCGTYSTLNPVSVIIAPPAFSITPSLVSLCPSSPAQLMTAIGDTLIGSVSGTNTTTTFVEHLNAPDSTNITVSGIPSGATITSVVVTFNVAAKSTGQQRDNVYNLRAPNGNVLNLDNAKGSSISGLGFTNVSISSAGTTALGTSTMVSGIPYIASLVSGAPTSGSFTATSYRSNVTAWSSLYSTPNGIWTMITDNTYNATEDTFKSWSLTINYVVNPTVTWSSLTGLYTNSGATTSYTGTSVSSVYALPSSSTSYIASSTIGSCSKTATVPVNVNSTLYLPSVSGPSSVCVGGNISLTDSTTGGVWTCNNTSIATIGSSTGIVTGVTGGSATITYTYTSGSCTGFSTRAVTVNSLPAISPITGTTNLCLSGSLTSTLSDATSGTHTWSSSNIAVATIGSSTGVVTAVTAGTAIITYNYNNGICSNITTTNVTVANTPSPITVSPSFGSICNSGPAQSFVASGGNAPASVAVSSGAITFSIGNTAAGVNTGLAISGIPSGATVTGIAVNFNATESFDGDLELNLKAPNASVLNLFSSGTSNNGANFVNTTISSAGVTPIPNLGAGAPFTGVWAANASLSPTVGSSTTPPTTNSWAPLMTGDPNGTWTLAGRTNYAGNTATLTSWSVTISYNYQVPVTWSSISGLYTNSGATTAYTGTPANTIYAMPVASTVYTVTATNGACTNTASVTANVSSTLYVPVINGLTTACVGGTITLNDSTTGGVWTSANTSIATVGSSSGIVTGTGGGTTNITYTYTSGSCTGFAVKAITINALPIVSAISGSGSVCSGTTITLTNATSGGSWSSSTPAVATIGTTGVVTPVSEGSTIISYTYSNGTCTNVVTSTVNSFNMPGAVTVTPSSATVCASGPAALFTTTGGMVSGSATFTTTSPQSFGSGLPGVSPITVSSIPTGAVINGVSVKFNATQFSGGWDSDDIFNIAAPNGHVFNLINAKGGSSSTQGFTNTIISSAGTIPIPATGAPYTGIYNADSILGTGLSPWASDSSSWSCLYSSGSPNGVWNFVGSYIFTSGTTTINNWSLTLTYTYPANYTWASTAGLYTNSGASTPYTGIVTNNVYALPIANTTYTVTATNGTCTSASTATVSVNPVPASIGGTASVCVGSSTTLTNSTTSGTWSSSDASIASIGSSTGVVNGISVGTTTITYMLSTGCFITTDLTVNPLPASITGTTTVCVLSSTTLSDAGGGTWSSSNTALASVGSSSGIVTGNAAGNPAITYTLATGCYATAALTVNPLPSAISGVFTVCTGLNVTLTDASPSGLWSSSNTAIADIGSSTGVVTGNSSGNANITYTLPTGCQVISPFTVNPLPSAISGASVVCVGSGSTLSDAGGGTWSSSNTSLATIGSSSGLLSGVSAGNPNITYTLPTGCIATIIATINPLPSAISGTSGVCVGSAITLTDAGGGTWSSSNTAQAGIGSSSGIVTGLAVGTPAITYTISTGCFITSPITVNPLPAAISGSASICSGSATTLSDATTGGTWTSSNTSVATAGSSTGIISGMATGTATISYTLPTGCYAAVLFSVNTTPTPISGSSFNCTGTTSLLTDAISGGVWSSSNPAVADIGSSTGLVIGSSVGTTTISYILTGGCFATKSVTVNSSPAAITGSFTICAGQTTALFDASTGGTWSSSNTALAIVDSSGLVTGIASGSPVITYNVSSGCFSTAVININPLPATYTVTGGGGLCTGGTGIHIGLSNSDIGVNYQLYLGTTAVGSLMAGTGAPIDFGVYTTGGIYTVSGTNTITLCTGNMAGSVVINVSTVPIVFTVTGGGSFCSGSTGVHVGLLGSTPGVNYQLYNYSTPVGIPVSGTGVSLDFGIVTLDGPYNVIAANASTGCTSVMTSSVVVTVNPLPTPYTVSGGGVYCAGGTGVHVYLNISSIGINYQLFNGVTPVGGYISGTSSVLDYGLQTALGTYTIVGTNTSTGCINTMSGSTVISTNPLPPIFNMTGGGGYCTGGTGIAVGLNGSTSGFTYQLFSSGVAVGSAITGSGASLNFGLQTLPGSYTVVATNPATGCTSIMAGSSVVVINSLPVVFTVTGGGSYCTGGTGVGLGLNGSETGVNYQLYNGVTSIGSAIAGTGAAISFGTTFTAAGSYTVVATNPTTGCVSNMFSSASVVINPLPALFTVGSTATSYCTGGTGVHITLSGSVTGVSYALYNSGTVAGGASGTGGALDFGVVLAAGTYTVIATNTSTTCTSTMTGSAVISVNPLPTLFALTGGGAYCSGATAPVIGLAGSTSGVSYQLYRSGIAVGTSVNGTGSAISFASQSIAGSYTVIATNTSTGCIYTMTGSVSVTILPLPTVYNVTGGGNYCSGGAGVHVGISSSDIGVTYQLYNGIAVGIPVNGTGGSIDFGSQTAIGTYTVIATNTATGCIKNMFGSATINISLLPIAYSVTGGGNYCTGGSGRLVGLNYSEAGVNYQLYIGSAPTGGIVTGTGSAISFGMQTVAGNYTVIGTNTATGCVQNMTGVVSVAIDPLPVSYSITGGGSYCTGGSGVSVGLITSAGGVNYQLYINGTAVTGSLLSGTGFALNFGLQTASGNYTVIGTNVLTTCANTMSGVATVSLNSLPAVFTVNGGGSYCSGGSGLDVSLNATSAGIYYQLYINLVPNGAPVAGTGTTLNFGLQTASGSYTVAATDPVTTCTANMSGAVTISVSPAPILHNITGGGNYCPGGPGVHIGLNGSNTGTSYQLFNGALAIGSPVNGTGSPIDFGLQASVGTYNIVATIIGSGCTIPMTGTVSVGLNTLPSIFNVTGGGNYCSSGSGVHVGLSGSVSGNTYQLYHNGSIVGSPFSGTGSILDYGLRTLAGNYTVVATNTTTTCSSTMNGTAIIGINPLPSVHTVTGGGSYCSGGSGVHIGLDGTDMSTLYQLYRGTSMVGSSLLGTGSLLDFGLQTVAGSYIVSATNLTTTCTNNMGGSANITVNPLPALFLVTGGGHYCNGGSGVHIYLAGSEPGMSYRLYNGAIPVGSPVLGTGSSLDFGLQTASGTYQVVATSSNSCVRTMTGNPAIVIDPVPTAFLVSGGGNYCAGGSGLHILLNGSTSGISYQLLNGSIPSGGALAGTSATLDFGLNTGAGNYTVIATNPVTSCTATMSGSATITINTLPGIFNLTSVGTSFCSGGTGVDFNLTGSEIGVNYQLYNGTIALGSSVSGTGAVIDLGYRSSAGTYHVIATNSSNSCTNAMNGNPIITVNPLPTPYTVTGGGAYCNGGIGVNIGLSGSNAGINYQLYNTYGMLGASVSGTGGAIDFGPQTVAVSYYVVATNATTGCTNNMAGTGNVTINSLPTLYNVSGSGSYCSGGSGVHIYLIGSSSGVTYKLMNGTTLLSSFSGTGTSIDFGPQTLAGNYTVVAVNNVTTCTRNMNGSATVVVNSLPVAYPVTGGGGYCAGTAGVPVGLGGSNVGVHYQLYNGALPIGPIRFGTGSNIDFGIQTNAGTYSVKATNDSTGCTNTMTGIASVVINSLPTVYHVTGGGRYCIGGSGVHVGLNNSTSGISYQLYNGFVLAGSPVTSIGGPLDFGLQTSAGTYYVMATNPVTLCTRNMSDSAVVAINSTVLPSVTISNGGLGDTVCSGHLIAFTANPVNGGIAPSYIWSINGVYVSSGSSYSYIPVNGDLIGVSMTSNADCPVPATVVSSRMLTVETEAVPSVVAFADPGNTICKNTTVTMMVNPSYGGSAPTFTWLKGGVISGASSTYTFVPVNGDDVYCVMNSNYHCRTHNTAISNHVVFAVDSNINPGVTIIASPDTFIAHGQTLKLTAIVSNGGSSPSYEWLVNGITVAGANSTAFIRSNFADNDIVTCKVISDGTCSGNIGTHSVTIHVSNVGVQPVVSANSGFIISPNPNKGQFNIKGSIDKSLVTSGNDDLFVEVINTIGQTVYTQKIKAINGVINEQIDLGRNIANGMYLVNLRTASENRVFHIVIEQ